MSTPAAAGPYVASRTGQVWRGEDEGAALVVNCQVDPAEALCELLTEGYGGTWTPGNPVIAEAAAEVKVEVWRSTTKAWREGEGVGDEWTTDWWAPHGDGARQVLVAYYPGDVYALGHDAEAAEVDANQARATGRQQ